MSEELKKRSAFELFAQVKQTYVEAEEKAKQEAGSPRVERFRIGEDGEYTVRILPLAPVLDSEGNVLPLDRKGYEYPIRQLFLGIETASKKGGKKKVMNIPVIRTTDKGVDYSVDLIDTYVKIAKEMYGDDEKTAIENIRKTDNALGKNKIESQLLKALRLLKMTELAMILHKTKSSLSVIKKEKKKSLTI